MDINRLPPVLSGAGTNAVSSIWTGTDPDFDSLFGVTILQTWIYINSSRKDRRLLRIFVSRLERFGSGIVKVYISSRLDFLCEFALCVRLSPIADAPATSGMDLTHTVAVMQLVHSYVVSPPHVYRQVECLIRDGLYRSRKTS
jgi:hypothetical protein